MDALKWFKFSPTSWALGKIQKVPEATQLRFINLCGCYWNKGCIMTVDDAELEVDKEHLDILIQKRIVKVNEGSINIVFLDEQLLEISNTSEQKSKAALKRWNAGAKTSNADAMHVHKDAMPLDKSREDKIREEKSLVVETDVSKLKKTHHTDFETFTSYLSISKNYEAVVRQSGCKADHLQHFKTYIEKKTGAWDLEGAFETYNVGKLLKFLADDWNEWKNNSGFVRKMVY